MKSGAFVIVILLLFIAACTISPMGPAKKTKINPPLVLATSTATPITPTAIPTPNIDVQVKDLLSKMSIDEKIGQMAQISNIKDKP